MSGLEQCRMKKTLAQGFTRQHTIRTRVLFVDRRTLKPLRLCATARIDIHMHTHMHTHTHTHTYALAHAHAHTHAHPHAYAHTLHSKYILHYTKHYISKCLFNLSMWPYCVNVTKCLIMHLVTPLC